MSEQERKACEKLCEKLKALPADARDKVDAYASGMCAMKNIMENKAKEGG